jgi:pimeloyl-ACP methyl ester carboxylesterase
MKLKFIPFLLFSILLKSCANSETITGYWTGTMEVNGNTADFSLDLNDSTISSRDNMFLKQRIQNLSFKNDILRFSYITDDANLSFEGVVDSNNIKGHLKIQGMPPEIAIHFNLSKQSDTSPSENYTIEKLTISSKGANISAEIYKPKTNSLHPALVLLYGSGDYTKSWLAFDADFFAKQGIEVLIYDKRGSGKSTGNRITATYENLAEDAIACLEILNQRETVDKSKIGLWGLSQGAMLLPFIASKTDIPSFLIAIAPEVYGAYEAAAFSDSLRVINGGYSSEEGHFAAESHRKVAKMIRNGSDYKEVLNFINNNAQKYPFMNLTGLHDRVVIDKEIFKGYYWSGRKYNFYNYWKNLDIETLCVFGEDDSYVDAIRNVNTLNSFNNTKIETKLFSGANHILKKTPNFRDFSEFDFPRVKEGYLEFVRQWIENEFEK